MRVGAKLALDHFLATEEDACFVGSLAQSQSVLLTFVGRLADLKQCLTAGQCTWRTGHGRSSDSTWESHDLVGMP